MTSYSFRVLGRVPGMNEMIKAAKGARGTGVRYARLKKKWTNDIALLARAARIPHMARAFLTFEWYEPPPSKFARPRDPDNVAAGKKVVLDGLVRAGVLPDDKLAQIAGWRDDFQIGGQVGVVVTLEPR